MANLGINTIGRLEWPTILAGDFPRVTTDVIAGEDLVTGSIVYRDTDNTVKLWRGTVTVNDESVTDDVYAVVAEDIKSGNVGIAWMTGEFVGPRLTVADANVADWTAAIDSARGKSIFLKTARLAPNQ